MGLGMVDTTCMDTVHGGLHMSTGTEHMPCYMLCDYRNNIAALLGCGSLG